MAAVEAGTSWGLTMRQERAMGSKVSWPHCPRGLGRTHGALSIQELVIRPWVVRTALRSLSWTWELVSRGRELQGQMLAEEAVGIFRQSGKPYCKALSSESPGRTVHSPRSHGPVRQIQRVLTLLCTDGTPDTGGASCTYESPPLGSRRGVGKPRHGVRQAVVSGPART